MIITEILHLLKMQQIIVCLLLIKNLKKYEIFNICSSNPIHITKVIKEIDKYIKKPKIIKKPRIKRMFIKHLEIIKKLYLS